MSLNQTVEMKTLRDLVSPPALQDIDGALGEAVKNAESLSQKLDVLERWLPVMRNRMVNAKIAHKRMAAKCRLIRGLGIKQAEELDGLYVESVNAEARVNFLEAEYEVIKREYRRHIYGDRA